MTLTLYDVLPTLLTEILQGLIHYEVPKPGQIKKLAADTKIFEVPLFNQQDFEKNKYPRAFLFENILDLESNIFSWFPLYMNQHFFGIIYQKYLN